MGFVLFSLLMDIDRLTLHSVDMLFRIFSFVDVSVFPLWPRLLQTHRRSMTSWGLAMSDVVVVTESETHYFYYYGTHTHTHV